MSQEKNPPGSKFLDDQAPIAAAINKACRASFGVLDTTFLCRSISVLEPRKPLCVAKDATLESVVSMLQSNRIGCVMITDASGKLTGIFSERDALLKVIHQFEAVRAKPISDFMTKDPVAQTPDSTIGFVLNLMSTGGFRHMPIVDNEGLPIGIVSVKDVVDFIVKSFTDDLLSFGSDV